MMPGKVVSCCMLPKITPCYKEIQIIFYYKKRCSHKNYLGVSNFKKDYLYNNGNKYIYIYNII